MPDASSSTSLSDGSSVVSSLVPMLFAHHMISSSSTPPLALVISALFVSTAPSATQASTTRVILRASKVHAGSDAIVDSYIDHTSAKSVF